MDNYHGSIVNNRSNNGGPDQPVHSLPWSGRTEYYATHDIRVRGEIRKFSSPILWVTPLSRISSSTDFSIHRCVLKHKLYYSKPWLTAWRFGHNRQVDIYLSVNNDIQCHMPNIFMHYPSSSLQKFTFRILFSFHNWSIREAFSNIFHILVAVHVMFVCNLNSELLHLPKIFRHIKSFLYSS